MLWLSRIEIWGIRFTSIFPVFCVMAEWITKMLFMLFFAYIAAFFPVHNNIWNSLSDDIVSLNQFKQKLSGLDLSLKIICNFSNCLSVLLYSY